MMRLWGVCVVVSACLALTACVGADDKKEEKVVKTDSGLQYMDLKEGTEAVGELVFTNEASFSLSRYIPDGGSILVPLHYRPRAVRNKDRWLVAEVKETTSTSSRLLKAKRRAARAASVA